MSSERENWDTPAAEPVKQPETTNAEFVSKVDSKPEPRQREDRPRDNDRRRDDHRDGSYPPRDERPRYNDRFKEERNRDYDRRRDDGYDSRPSHRDEYRSREPYPSRDSRYSERRDDGYGSRPDERRRDPYAHKSRYDDRDDYPRKRYESAPSRYDEPVRRYDDYPRRSYNDEPRRGDNYRSSEPHGAERRSNSDDAPPNKTLGLFNMSCNVDNNMLLDHLDEKLAKFKGNYDAKVIIDRNTGKCRGYSFVTFRSLDDAIAAKSCLEGCSLDERPYKVVYSIRDSKPSYAREENYKSECPPKEY
jgi:RNA recognition motif. (a.k.a. RRM, RBD, or RNP domain)